MLARTMLALMLMIGACTCSQAAPAVPTSAAALAGPELSGVEPVRWHRHWRHHRRHHHWRRHHRHRHHWRHHRRHRHHWNGHHWHHRDGGRPHRSGWVDPT